MKLALNSSIALLLLAACSKPSPEEQKKREDQLAAALASAMNAPSSAPSAAPGAAAAPAGAISATCNNKGDGVCTETMGAAGLGAENSCTVLGGVYAKGSTPCPRENVVGTCAQVDATSGLNDLRYYYKGAASAADMKMLCESVMSGVWAAAPKPTAQAASRPAAPTKPRK